MGFLPTEHAVVYGVVLPDEVIPYEEEEDEDEDEDQEEDEKPSPKKAKKDDKEEHPSSDQPVAKKDGKEDSMWTENRKDEMERHERAALAQKCFHKAHHKAFGSRQTGLRLAAFIGASYEQRLVVEHGPSRVHRGLVTTGEVSCVSLIDATKAPVDPQVNEDFGNLFEIGFGVKKVDPAWLSIVVCPYDE